MHQIGVDGEGDRERQLMTVAAGSACPLGRP